MYYRETGSAGKDYPHNPDEMTNDKVSAELKAIKTKYRSAVDLGRKSGHGRIVRLYFNECEQFWGGSPAMSKIASLESFKIIEKIITDDANTLVSHDSFHDRDLSCSIMHVKEITIEMNGN